MAISFVAMATETLILFLDVVFELNDARILFYIFFWFSSRQFLFTRHYVYFKRNLEKRFYRKR